MTTKPSPQPPRPSATRAEPSGRADLAAFLAGWFRAWQAGRLYGPGHPVVCKAATQAAAAAAGLRKPRSMVVLPEGFESDGSAVESNTTAEALRALAAALHGMDIGSIELTPGLTAADIEASALALADASDQPVIDRVNATAPGRLNLRAVTYRGVNVRDAARTDSNDPDTLTRDRLWSRLNTGILDPASEATDPRLLAQQIGAEVAAHPHPRAALTGLRDSLVGTAHSLAQRSEPEQRRGLEHLYTLLSGLGPQLRASLEHAAAAYSPTPGAPQANADSGNPTMAAEIAGALTRGESARAELSSEALMFCQKLGDLRSEMPHENDGDENPAHALAGALESLFSRFDPTEFVPDDYRSQIRGTLNTEKPEARWPGLNQAFAAESLGVRCAHIACDLLDAETAAPSTALQEVIAASVVPLIDARAFTLLFSRLQYGDASLTQALTRDVVIDRLLAADVRDQKSEDRMILTELISRGGDRVVDRVVHRMIAGPADAGDARFIGPAAEKVLGAATAASRAGALNRALAQAETPLPRAVAPLLAGLAFNTATDMLKTRLNAPQVPERRAAYELLAAAFPQWPAHFLSQALRDREPGVQRCVLDRLSAGGNAQHLSLTKLTLVGQSAAGVLPAEDFDRLAGGTLARGTEGRWVAARALRILASAFSPQRAACGVQLARALTDHRDHPPVRHALLLWRLMPARWLARLAGPLPAVPAVQSASPSAPSKSATAPRNAA